MAFITIAGEQLIAQKIGNSQVLEVANFVLANVPGLGAEPDDRIAVLPPVGQIVDTKAVTKSGYVNANQVVFSVTLDSTIGDYDFNWVGLLTQESTLLAVQHIPLQQKRKSAGAAQGNNLVRNFLLAFAGAATVTAINVPAATWQIDFTQRLLQIDDRERLDNLDSYGSAAFFGDGFKVALQSGSNYTVAAGVGYVGGLRCEIATPQVVNAGTLPKGIWLDVSLQGDINGVTPVIVLTASAAALSNNTDAQGFHHYLFKIADIAAGGAITDLRPGVVVTQAEAEAGTGTTIKRWTVQRVWLAALAALAPWIVAHLAAADPHPGYVLESALPADNADTSNSSTTPATTAWCKFGFIANFADNGYIRFPKWLGSWQVCWGFGSTNAGGINNVTFPLAFTSFAKFATGTNMTTQVLITFYNYTLAGMTVQSWSSHSAGAGAPSSTFNYVAVGK